MTQRHLKVVGYVRVSTTGQAEDGCSLDAQKAKLRAYATAMDLELVQIYEDAGISAKTTERPGLQAALDLLTNKQADGILVTKLDRLTRSVKDLGTLIESHFTKHALLSVSDSIDTRSAGGRLVLNVLASVSQWEREAISERTREALAHLKSTGVQLGAPRYSGPAIARATALAAYGLRLAQIASRHTEEGHPTARGGRWSTKMVRRLLQRNELAPRSAIDHGDRVQPPCDAE